MFRQTRILILLLVTLAILPVACSHMPPVAADSQAALELRIDQLWAARKAKDLRTVHEMTDLTYRKAVSVDQFIQKPGFNVLTYETGQIDLQGDNALVNTTFETRKMAITMKLPIKEKWLFEEGAWRLNLTEMMRQGPFGPWGTGVKK